MMTAFAPPKGHVRSGGLVGHTLRQAQGISKRESFIRVRVEPAKARPERCVDPSPHRHTMREMLVRNVPPDNHRL